MNGPRRSITGVLIAVFVLAACASSSDSPGPTGSTETTNSSETVGSDVTSVTDASTDVADSGTVAAPEFAPLNPAEGFGFLRVMTLEERPGPRDIVIYEAIPNELPRVAGVITAVAQTPLSHVNLRAVQDDVPNAYIENALTDPSIRAHIGSYVKYTVTTDDFTVSSVTQAEVEAHHTASRPTDPQTPERDLAVTEVAALADIGFDDWTAYGVKTANLATLGRLDLPGTSVPDGFAVPFSFYVDFMESNGFFDRVRAMLDDPQFRDDPTTQDQQLDALREAIKDAPMSAAAMDELTSIQESFPTGTPIRCRSSTNNEDLPNFSGAGLYDSRTQHPDEGHLSKCIKQVYASTWNLRAFLERDFYRIDHLGTAMGVLLHPAFQDELANGVAVSIDPVYETPGAYYVNTQLGEDLVTNPDALSIPEALLIESDGAVAVATRSNLAPPGELLMTDSQIEALRSSLATIHREFAILYGVDASEPFAMEVEFKITADSELAIKQARTWVFN